MKNSWLLCGWCCLLLLWAHWISIWFSLALMLGLLWYYRSHYRIHPLFVLLLLLLQGRMLLLLREPETPMDTVLQIREIKAGYAIAHTQGQDVMVYGLKHANFNDIVQVKGTYAPVTSLHNFHRFYFPDWLKRRGIRYQIQAQCYQLLQEGSGVRHTLYAHVQGIADRKQRSWLNMLLYGIHEEDVSYFLTSSGLHIATLAACLQKLLLMICSQANASVIALLLLGLCGHVTVFSSSLIRILLFRLVTLCCHSRNLQDRLGISMAAVLLLFPYMAWELAFLLPLGFRMLALFNVRKRSRRLTGLLLLIPMQFLFFQSCNPLQLLLFPVFRYVYAFLYAGCLLSVPCSFGALFAFTTRLADLLDALQQCGITLYYTPQLLWLFLWGKGAVCYISYAQKKPLAVLCLLFLYAPFSSWFDPFGEVLMIDVGQGDCTLITLPFHQGAVMIDIMGSRYRNIPKEVVVPIVKAKGYQRLDALILTHDDFDHSGGKEELLKELNVTRIIDHKDKAEPIKGLPLMFLLRDYKGKDSNDNSIVTYMQTDRLKALFMGDAGTEAEAALLQRYDLAVDVLKVGHHGSDTSSSLSFLHELQPQLALVSAGRNNRYHHPSTAIMQRLRQENIPALVSARDGAVSIRFSRYFSYYVSAEGAIGILHGLWE